MHSVWVLKGAQLPTVTQKSCYLSGIVMWYKLTNPQETNIALNIIISTGNDIQIFPNYHIWRYLVKPLRQQPVRPLCAPGIKNMR